MTENKLIKAYDDLMGHLYEALDDTLHSIAEALEIAKEKTFRLGIHTQDEINQVVDSVMRDVEHAAVSSPNRHQDSLKAWLKFDIDFIEIFTILPSGSKICGGLTISQMKEVNVLCLCC